MRALCTIIALLALAAPAQAADTVRVGIESSIRQLITSPDGGAWVHSAKLNGDRVIRVTPQGAVRVTRVRWVSEGALGPDGQAWFESGDGITRFDGNGVKSTLAKRHVTSTFAAGPDGTAWFTGPELLRMAPDGTQSPLTLDVPGCPGLYPSSLALATDGAMWFYIHQCGFVRLAPGGTPVIVADPELPAAKLVPDLAGGVWFAHHVAPGGGHVDATGKVTLLKAQGHRGTQDVAIAPDGSAWFASGRCFVARAGADGTLTRRPTALPADHIGFDPAGGLWLASASRLRHTTLDASATGCDDTPPIARIVPDPTKPVRVADLRRHGGFKITVREPFTLEGSLFDGPADESLADVEAVVTARRGRTVHLEMSPALIRQVAKRKGEPLVVVANIRDREGNEGGFDYALRLRR